MMLIPANTVSRLLSQLLHARDTSAERYRRVLLTAVASTLAKVVAILTGLVSVPLTLSYLGPERYGVWATMTALVNMLTFSDMGIGHGLMNAISEAYGRNDTFAARRYISSAIALLSGIAGALAGLLALTYNKIPWARIFNVSSLEAVSDVSVAGPVLIASFLVGLPLGIVQRVHMGYQEGFLASLWGAFGNLLGLVGVLVVIHFQGGLAWLVLAYMGAPLLASVLNGMVLFGQRHWLRPRLQDVTWQASKKVLGLGLQFMLLQIAVALAFSSDNVVAAQVLGPAAVTTYATTMKLFNLAPMLVNMLLFPLWPAYGEAIARGDIVWVRKTLKRSLWLAVAFTAVPSTVLLVFITDIIRLWVGPGIRPERWLLYGMAVWSVLGTAGNAAAMMLNGANVLGFQVVSAIVMAGFSLAGKMWLAETWGLPGIIWATISAYLVFTVIPYATFLPKVIRRLESPNGPLEVEQI